MVRTEVDDFRIRRLPSIERGVIEKYASIAFSHLTHAVSANAVAGLTVSLYLKCTTFKDNPSYRQQLTMLYDFRQLLDNKRVPRYFTGLRKKYYTQYTDICSLLDELENYQKTGEVSAQFLGSMEIDKENIPVEHVEEYLAYVKEMTLVVIDEVTNMVKRQIYRLFPSEAPMFVQNILQENAYDDIYHAAVGDGIREISTGTKKVTFSL
jgi:hypothetical protein